MEPPPKRRRLDEPPPHFQSGWVGDATNTGPRTQSTSIFDGSGISNSHGDLRVGRDVNIITNHGGHSQPIDARGAVLESLRFDQIDARRQTIKNAYSTTCRWFLQTEQYKQWDDRGSSLQNRFLWIKGKPGAGKSTLMKFLHGHVSKQIRRTARDTTLISFFFNARGHQLEKSTIGLYRSLLVQLLEAKPALEHVLDPFRPGHEWTIETLRSVLEEAAQDLEDTPIICLIDALDECDQGQIRDMVCFFETLAHNQSSLQICFASRHYPHINIQTGLSIILEEREGHREDITTYLSSALRIGHSKRAEKIRSTLQEKARGVFMWLILVVEILNKDYDAGDVLELEDRIEQLPGDLHALFCNILTRDTKNRQALLLCIQWILYAKDPLTPTQLYLGILSGSDQKSLSKWNFHDHEEDDARRYILDKSKGLAEVTKAKIPTVQFIHESVNDFLLKEKGLARLFSDDLSPNVQGSSHEALKLCCLAYMHVGAVSIPEEPWTPFSRSRAIGTFPLLAYANHGMLYHAEQAGKHGIDQSDFLATFPQSNWVQRHNVLEKFEKRTYTPDVSLLYILAEAGLPTLIRAHSQRQSCYQFEAGRYGLPILAASSMKHGPTMEMMLELEAASRPSFDFEEFSKRFPLRRGHLEGTSLNFEFKRKRDLLVQLVEHGSDIVSLFYLMAEGRHAELTEEEKNVLLELAFKTCKTDVVRFLLDGGSPIPKTSLGGQTPLHLAAQRGFIPMIGFLIDNGASALSIDDFGETPLHHIKPQNTMAAAAAKFLIEKGADVSVINSNGDTALHKMCRFPRSSGAIADVLIENGADVSICNREGQTPLHIVARSTNATPALVKLLIKSGANVLAADHDGNTPLHLLSGHSATVAQILIDNGANLRAPNQAGKTVLHCIAHKSFVLETIKLLINHGASAMAVDNNGRTVLLDLLMSERYWTTDYHEKVRFLSESSVSVRAADKNGNTPLLVAARSGWNETVGLLLGRGADVSAANKNGETPLLVASSNRWHSIVEMLRERMSADSCLPGNNEAIL